MKTKKCSNCGEIKPLNEFYKDKTKKDGLTYQCKECQKKYRKKNKEKIKKYQKKYYKKNKEKIIKQDEKYRKKNKEKIRKRKKKYYKKNKDKIITRQKKYYRKNKDKILRWQREYQQNNKESRIEYQKKYRGKNKEKIKKQNREYSQKNKEKIKKRKKKYYQKNKDKIANRQNEYYKKKRREDPMFRLNKNISTAMSISLKGNKNGRHWEDLVGYKLEDLKKHLEQQFDDKMTWKNHGSYWHIDHIIPKSKFNYAKPEHIGFKRAWALENLQPLEARENIKKSDKLSKAKQEHLMI